MKRINRNTIKEMLLKPNESIDDIKKRYNMIIIEGRMFFVGVKNDKVTVIGEGRIFSKKYVFTRAELEGN